MTSNRKKFYRNIIQKIISEKNSKILVVGGTKFDAEIFTSSGFINVTIANLDNKTDYYPYKHSLQDLRNIKHENESFDYVVANACIHHTSKPHAAILEMYRICKKGIIVIEGNDSFFMRVANYFGLSQTYELSAIIDGDYTHDLGGVDNTIIPNFIYRWTEREVKKLISCYEPHYSHEINFFYDSDFEGYKSVKKINLISPIIFILENLAKIYFLFFKKEQNLFCFFVNKEKRKIKEWIKEIKDNKPIVDKEFIIKKIKKQ